MSDSQHMVIEAIERFSDRYNLSRNVVSEMLVDTLRQHFELYFGASVGISLSPSSINACYFKDDKRIDINWEHLPRDVLAKIRKSFEERLEGSKAEEIYQIWSGYKHTAREGVVVRERPISHFRYPGLGKYGSSNEVLVEIDGHVCVMDKSQFARHESYRVGDKMFWYILKVVRPCDVYLSRGSRSFPIALLNHHFPEGRFRCIKRIPGLKSVVISDSHISRDIIRSVSRELGEVLIINFYKKSSPQLIS